jgi:hypothetical protein
VAPWTITRDGERLTVTFAGRMNAGDMRAMTSALVVHLDEGPVDLVSDLRAGTGFAPSVASVGERAVWSRRQRIRSLRVVGGSLAALDERLELERLGQEDVEPGHEGLAHVLARGHGDGRRESPLLGSKLPDASHEVEAAPVRHPQVADDHVGRLSTEEIECCVARARFRHRGPLERQDVDRTLANVCVVFDDEHP